MSGVTRWVSALEHNISYLELQGTSPLDVFLRLLHSGGVVTLSVLSKVVAEALLQVICLLDVGEKPSLRVCKNEFVKKQKRKLLAEKKILT